MKKASKTVETIDDFKPPVRFYKGQKKTDKAPLAPWSGSTFETEYGRNEGRKYTEYTGVFRSAEKDCREKPLIPLSETREWMVGNTTDVMDLTTTNAATFPMHPRQEVAKTKLRGDHTSTFINKDVSMRGSSTYMRSFSEKQDAKRPAACRPGPPENIIAIELDHKFPKSVNCETYRSYDKNEQRGARRAPIVLLPEFGNIPSSSKVGGKHFATSYVDDFQKHKEYKRAIPLRPEENGIHYDLDSKLDLMTTHDRTFNSNRFPAHRKLQRNEPVGGWYQPVSTMMSDFKLKTINNPAKPFLPPVGLRETFGDEKNGYVTGYEQAFVSPDLKKITRVKNCKPVHQYKAPNVKMECQSTAHTHFTGKSCPPATSFRPNLIPREEDMKTEFKTEYNERYLQGS